MSPHTASPERVARSWLFEQMLAPGRRGPLKTPPPGARLMSDRERDKVLESSYKALKSDLIRTIKSQFTSLDQAERRIAKRHGIDPLFLNWFVVSGRRNWPTLPRRTREALRAMQSARMWFGEVPSSWRQMQVPSVDEARSRDAAIKELAEWFLRNFVAKVERKFTNSIWSQSRELLDLFKGPGKGSKSKASVLLLRDFKKRLGEDRFQLKPAVRRIVELFD